MHRHIEFHLVGGPASWIQRAPVFERFYVRRIFFLYKKRRRSAMAKMQFSQIYVQIKHTTKLYFALALNRFIDLLRQPLRLLLL